MKSFVIAWLFWRVFILCSRVIDMRFLISFLLFIFPLAYAQPPGLQGPFVPIDVVSVNAGPSETVAVLDYYARTDSGSDIYEREGDTFTDGEVVSLAADLIGTPWEDATCAALLDAGFVEPCAIPPTLPEPEDPAQYTEGGYCTPLSTNGYTGSTASFASTMGECERFMEDTIKAAWDASAFPTNGAITMACGGSGTGGGGGFRWMASRVGFGNSTMGYFVPNNPAQYCNVVGLPLEPAPPTPEPPTDAEIYEAILPAVSEQYFYDYSSQQIISNNSTINSTSNSITNNYNTYINQWQSGDPQVPPGFSPVPLPAPPAPPAPVPPLDLGPLDFSEMPSDCELSPNSLGCADAQSFLDVFTDYSSAAISGVIDPVFSAIPALQEVDPGAEIVGVSLASGSGCPAPSSVGFLNGSVEITYDMACSVATGVSPIILTVSAFFSLFILAGIGRGG